MGKKPNVRSTDQDLRQSLSLAQNAEFSPEARAAKAMFMLNEYMRYFGSINGLCKQIVEVEKEVLCRIGRAAWNEMTQEELDRVLDKHIVNKYITGQLSTDEGQTESLLPKPKSKSKAKRDSLHFLTDVGGQDGFSGPFSWRTTSLQDLAFPSTPELEIKAKKQESCDAAAEKHDKMENSKQDNADEEIKTSMTLDELKSELKRSYDDANAARQKMQQMEQMKSPDSKKEPEQITKSAVNAKLGLRTASVGSGKRPEMNGMPSSAADLKPVSALKPVNQERLKSPSMSNGTQATGNGTFHFRSTPDPLPRPTSHARSDSTERKQAIMHSGDNEDNVDASLDKRTQSTGSSGRSPRHSSFSNMTGRSPRPGAKGGKPHHDAASSSGRSPHHDSGEEQISQKSQACTKSPSHELVGASGKSHRDSFSNTTGKSPRHDSVGKSSDKSRSSGSFSKKTTSPDHVSVKELSEDLNQFFAGKTLQAASSNGDSDMLMDLFKNW